jgi:hypothetical protein
MNRLEVLGWWFNERAPNAYPRPQLLVSRRDPEERGALSRYLRSGRTLVTYREVSFCRFDCGERDMGCRDLTDGVFVWPEGLAHYIDKHEVRLPERFLAHVRTRGSRITPFAMPEPTFGLVDPGPWLAWARAQGACLDFDGWEIPTRAVALRIDAELVRVPFETIALCRGDTRQVVLVLADGALEVHQLRPGGHARQHLAGWHEWPIAR